MPDWTTPHDISDKVLGLWNKGKILGAKITGEPLFPLSLSLRRPDTRSYSERFEEVREDFVRIYCTIFVERGSQKKIIIGHGAERLKQIGIRARHDIENLLGHRCHLELFVKVEKDWRERAHLLDEMGIKQ